MQLQNFDIKDFLANYWQKKPMIIRQAWPFLPAPLDENDLAGLAMESASQSRLVFSPEGEDHCWTVKHGPFEEEILTTLPDNNWTLLVNDIDKWLWEVGEYLDAFHFLPSWRIDDIMMSFSADKGSVGPHVDQYDVFLIQTQGSKRWKISDIPEKLNIYPDCDLAIMRDFEQTEEYLLEPGDILYLPPGVPHYGIAEGHCATLSVGMRSPSIQDMLDDFILEQSKGSDSEVRFSDPHRKAVTKSGYVDQESRENVKALLRNALTMNDSEMDLWVGKMFTRYRLAHDMTAPSESIIPFAQIQAQLQEGQHLFRSPWSRFAWIEGSLFVSGEQYKCPSEIALFLCQNKEISLEILDGVNETVVAPMIEKLLSQGHFQLG